MLRPAAWLKWYVIPFRNRITLEMFNLGPWTIGLTADMKICSLVVERLGRAAEGGYQGMFQGG